MKMPLVGTVLGGRGADSVRAETCRELAHAGTARGGRRRSAGQARPREEAQLLSCACLNSQEETQRTCQRREERGSKGVHAWGILAGPARHEHSLNSLLVRRGNTSRHGVSSGNHADGGPDAPSAGPAALSQAVGCLPGHHSSSGGAQRQPQIFLKERGPQDKFSILLTTWGLGT